VIISFSDDRAWYDFLRWVKDDKKTFGRINKLIEDIKRNGNDGYGHPEPLTGNHSGWWSRRIDEKNRLIYRIVNNEVIEIIQCKGHYDDK